MLGLMQDQPLLISSLIEFAGLYHKDEEIVSRTIEGPIHRYTYADCAGRCRQLAKAIEKLDIRPGDRLGTLAWNGYRHLEIYYAVSGIGAICHTINPRLFPEQIVYIVNHAEDQYIFTDLTFVPLLEAVADQITVTGIMAHKAYSCHIGVYAILNLRARFIFKAFTIIDFIKSDSV